MAEEKKTYLGIDWGASDIGIAFADGEMRMAFALGTIKNDRDLLPKITEMIAERNVGAVVIGIPSHVNRKEEEYDGEKLGKAIQKLLPVRIAYQDEMFTTKMAEANLKAMGLKHVSRYDDAEAARIILQEWLDRKK
jgi:putative transcription antitermination factor YqgF